LKETTEVERSPMLKDWENQHSKNGYATTSNLYAQCNSHQNPNDIHHRDWKIYPKAHLQAQKTVNSQSNPEQKKQCWRYHNTWLQTILWSHSNKNSMVLTQKHIWRPVEQTKGPRYESMKLCPHNFWQHCPKLMMEKRQSLQQMLLGKLDICLQKTETRSMPVTLYKYQLKVDQRPKY
jgi:hypothetical protein